MFSICEKFVYNLTATKCCNISIILHFTMHCSMHFGKPIYIIGWILVIKTNYFLTFIMKSEL